MKGCINHPTKAGESIVLWMTKHATQQCQHTTGSCD